MNDLEKEILRYEKKGFEVIQKRKKLKYIVRVSLKKGKKFLINWAYYHVYIYYMEGNATNESISECFKDYLKVYEGEEGEETKGFFIVKGTLDEKLFKDLRLKFIKKGGGCSKQY
jgi:hypothetical protein